MNDNPFKEFFRSCWKNVNFMMGAIMLISVIVFAVFANQIAPYSFDQNDNTAVMQAPSSAHILGTDNMGRDLFSRIIYGTRITLKVALIGGAIELALGVVVGLMCGFYGGIVDRLMLFVADLTWCVPGMIMALAVVTIIGSNLTNAIIAIALVNWAFMARTVRAKTMSLKNMAFIETGVAFGENSFALMFRYILPNIVPVLIVMVSMSLPGTIMSTTTLSFLGVGSQPPSPDWGLMVSDGLKYITRAPWLAIYPGLALVYAVLSFSILGEGLRDLLDPRSKSQG
ncbi:MAG: ABC transporter permease [Clostridiaceae bacterium]|nr:ABC transporter permease [Clostridiaceae bacterium]